MASAKDQVQQILRSLPDDASLEEIQYSIFVRQMITSGVEDADAGRVISHADVRRRLAEWLPK